MNRLPTEENVRRLRLIQDYWDCARRALALAREVLEDFLMTERCGLERLQEAGEAGGRIDLNDLYEALGLLRRLAENYPAARLGVFWAYIAAAADFMLKAANVDF